MKKFFSFMLVALMAIPTFADKIVEFGAADFAGKGTANTGSEVSVVKDGITFHCDKGYGDGKFGVRCYKESTVTISAEENIKQIDFEFGAANGKTYDGSLSSSYSVGANEWTSGVLASQARMNKITVTLGEGGTPMKIDTISPERAKEIGNALESGASTAETYVVKGYVTYAKDYATDYNNQDFYMASDAANDAKDNFYAFRTNIAAPGVKVGDLVTVKGKILKYAYESGDISIQIKGGVCEIISSATTAVEDVQVNATKAVKVIENGQLVIIRDGVRYNAVGAVVE